MDFYIGLISGTSLDGVDASLIQTDGDRQLIPIANLHLAYPEDFRNRLKSVIDSTSPFYLVEASLTNYHVSAVKKLLKKADQKASNIKAIGFHGQTIFHDPSRKLTWQIGNPHQLAGDTNIDVIYDFRRRDIALSGQGAPLVPIFHKCIMQDESHPVAVVNIGGVANITYVNNEELVAFDTGPGNSLIDDAMNQLYNLPFDDQGKIAESGSVDHNFVDQILSHDYFKKAPPKSLDRNEFSKLVNLINEKSSHDIIASLTYLTAKSIIKALDLLPGQTQIVYLCGGGSKNFTLIKFIEQIAGQKMMKTNFLNISQKNLNPDFIESQAFAYIAARFFNNLPSAFPSTTGALIPNICGSIVKV